MSGKVDLIGPWNQFWGQITGGNTELSVALAIVGAVLIVVSVLVWLWTSRKNRGGQVMSGFPWVSTIVGGLLAAPTVVIPAILLVLQGFLNVLAYFVNWFAGML